MATPMEQRKLCLALALLATAIAAANGISNEPCSVKILNPGFEACNYKKALRDWDQEEPIRNTGKAKTGNSAAKAVNSSGIISQRVRIEKGGYYLLHVWFNGTGTMGAKIDGKTFESNVTPVFRKGRSVYQPVQHRFFAGNSSSAVIFARGGDVADVYVDDFYLLRLDCSPFCFNLRKRTQAISCRRRSLNRNLLRLQRGENIVPEHPTPKLCVPETAVKGALNPLLWDNSEASDDYITSTDPLVLEFDGLDHFYATRNGNGPREEVKTPKRNRVSSNATYESFSADITFDLDNGVRMIPHQLHGSGPVLVLLYV